MRYRRACAKGGTFFFTVNLADRSRRLLVEHIDYLRTVTRKVQRAHPFIIIAAVVLPEHLHCIWQLPEGDTHYATRWSLIKAGFSRCLTASEYIRPSRDKKRERGIWQRRYWEHLIQDEADLQKHVDYIHYNPVKHGHVAIASEWQYSSLHKYIRLGWATKEWGTGEVTQQGNYGE